MHYAFVWKYTNPSTLAEVEMMGYFRLSGMEITDYQSSKLIIFIQ